MGKGENACWERAKQMYCHFGNIHFVAFNLDPAKILLFSTGLTLSQISLCFYESAVQDLENTVGKGEIARKEQFLLFPTVFFTLFENFLPFSSNLRLSSAKTLNLEQYLSYLNLSFGNGLKCAIWKRDSLHYPLTHYHTIPTCNTSGKESF